jgi:putative peptide zinc metalloprotease protein
MGEVTWVVKHPENGKIYNFEDPDWGLIALFDGTRTQHEILDEYRRRVPGVEAGLTIVLDYTDMLRKIGFLSQTVAERSLGLLENARHARRRAAEEKAEGFNIFFLLFKVFDPNRLLGRTMKYVRWIWRPPTVALACISFLFTIGVFVVHFGPIWSETLELYSFLKKPFWDAVQFFAILTCIGCIHEFAHGYTVRFYGGEVHDMGIALLYFMPAFYCDTTDSLLFESKWQRLWVTIAGIYVEAILCTAATLLWVASYPDTLLNELAYKTMLFTGVSTVFFNINPLIKIDGYHALTSLLEIPELREDSFRYLGALFQRHVLRLNVPVPALSRRRRRIFLVYAPLALVYTGLIMLFIWGLLGNFYGRYVPDFALVLCLVTMAVFFKKRVRLVVRTGRLVYLDKKELLVSKRARVPLIAAAGVLLLISAVPWSRSTIPMEAVLSPARLTRLDAPEDGVLREVRVREGEHLEAGQVVLTIESPRIDAELAGLTARRQGLAREASSRREAAEQEGAYRSETRGAAVAAAVATEEERKEDLVLRSPFTGLVLTPRPGDLEGRFVRAGTPLVEIADCRTLVAQLPVSERLLRDLSTGDEVTVQLRSRPFSPLTGRIVTIAPAATSPVTSPSTGRIDLRPAEKPTRFVAVAEFENLDGSLLPGMGGRARIHGKRSSLLFRAGRILARWGQSTFW